MHRRDFNRLAALGSLAGLLQHRQGFAVTGGRPLNIMLFTADDLGPDVVGPGFFGGEAPDITPHLDRFAAESMVFRRAHVNAAICVPSRGCLATGRYGHNSGVYGFFQTKRPVPTIMETLREAGYLTGILGKVRHSTPKASYTWDYSQDQPDLGAGRSPSRYYECSVEFLSRCRREGKPFYFMVNSHDPHRPFQTADGKLLKGAELPSRMFQPDEIPVPGYLPDLPGVRQELSAYFNSVRRLDDTFGKVMQALDESGMADSTLVMFLSDNGIAVPFSKCNCYLASTHTPWTVRWPGVVAPGSSDDDHFISGIDFFPTVLDTLGLPVPEGLDGRSFLPLLHGREQSGRDHVFTQIDYKAGGAAVPMRCVQDERYGYLFNAWSDGKTEYHNNNEGLCMKAMVAAAPHHPDIAQRVRVFRYRELEEFYDLQRDPDCLHNLVGVPTHRALLDEYRARLRSSMVASHDPLLTTFDHRDDPQALKAEYDATYLRLCPRPSNRSKTKRRKKSTKTKRHG